MVHDTVAQKNFDPVLPPLPDNIDEDFDEESVKIVRLVKNKEPLVGAAACFSLTHSSPASHPHPKHWDKTLPEVFRVSDSSFAKAAARPCGASVCRAPLPLGGYSPSQLWPTRFVQ